MNVYAMYTVVGRAGFWVRRKSWGNTVALVKSVGGINEGELPGNPPYHGNPVVIVDVYSVAGELLETDAELSCPGTGDYELVKPPAWAAACGLPSWRAPR